MDYTREPIIETVITPRDGYRIAVRSSKNPGQEEFSVEALEIVSFGAGCFFRSLERPKAFMVPASDYEVLEIRETRVALKAASPEGAVKVPSGRDVPRSGPRDIEKRKPVLPQKETVTVPAEPERSHIENEPIEEALPPAALPEVRHERRNERRRSPRRRRGRDDAPIDESRSSVRKEELPDVNVPPVLEPTSPLADIAPPVDVKSESTPPVLSTLLPPPPTLIRDDIERLRRSDRYKGAFYIREPEEETKATADDDEAPAVPLLLKDDEPSEPPQEENIYKASPAPLEE